MKLLNNIEEEIGYAVNVSMTGTPFYIYPCIVNESKLTMAKNYFKDKGLYYLFDHGMLVYIGISTRNVYERILSHLEDKKFDSYFVFTCMDDNGVCNEDLLKKCTEYESHLIKLFSPEYNSKSNCALIEVCERTV